jgi:hypothetical protein
LTTKHQKTLQERTFDQLVDQEWESLSEAARTVIEQALEIASKWYLIHNISYMSEWYEDDMKAMRRTVAGLTEHDCKGLTHIWRSALATAASIDPYDYETHLGYGVYPADLWILQGVLKNGGGYRVGEAVRRGPEEGARRAGTDRCRGRSLLMQAPRSRGRTKILVDSLTRRVPA